MSRRVTYVSKAYEQIWGRYVEALYSDPKDWFRHIHPEDGVRLEEAMDLASLGGLDEHFRVIRPDGNVRWLHVRNFPIHDEEGVIRHVGGIATDVTDLMADQRQLVHLAHYDSLTALPNQLLFYEQLRRLIALSQRTGLRLGVMIIDLDRFRTVNETLGHNSGDELLRQVAGRLAGSLRESDMVCRLNGDVFAAILAELENTEQAAVVGRRVIDTLALPVKVDGLDLFATASLGIAFYPQDGQDSHSLVCNAEAAMRFAKQNGRNNYQYFSETMHSDARGRIFLETDLRNAVIREEFVLYYQPKVSCANGRMTGAEALLRWQHPRRGIVPPDEFIPPAGGDRADHRRRPLGPQRRLCPGGGLAPGRPGTAQRQRQPVGPPAAIGNPLPGHCRGPGQQRPAGGLPGPGNHRVHADAERRVGYPGAGRSQGHGGDPVPGRFRYRLFEPGLPQAFPPWMRSRWTAPSSRTSRLTPTTPRSPGR